jgi:FMN phosphatase YigB (HAD superfamily)
MVRALKTHYELRPGAKALFDLLKLPKTSPWGPHREIPVAIYSDYPMLRERLEALGLDPGSKIRLYGPESFGAQKPAPRPFRHIAADLGLRPEETLIIGDREDTDGRGALTAGMRFYCLETGRKRHFRLDPGRSPRGREAQVQPILMYLGTWETICRLLHGFIQGSES